LLPRDIALKILANLDSDDLERAAKVNPNWNALVDSEDLWKHKCGDLGFLNDFFSIDKYGFFKFFFFNSIETDLNSIAVYSNLNDWRRMFERAEALKSNWSNSLYKMINLRGHQER
jgi:hypothetical protein